MWNVGVGSLCHLEATVPCFTTLQVVVVHAINMTMFLIIHDTADSGNGCFSFLWERFSSFTLRNCTNLFVCRLVVLKSPISTVLHSSCFVICCCPPYTFTCVFLECASQLINFPLLCDNQPFVRLDVFVISLRDSCWCLNVFILRYKQKNWQVFSSCRESFRVSVCTATLACIVFCPVLEMWDITVVEVFVWYLEWE